MTLLTFLKIKLSNKKLSRISTCASFPIKVLKPLFKLGIKHPIRTILFAYEINTCIKSTFVLSQKSPHILADPASRPYSTILDDGKGEYPSS